MTITILAEIPEVLHEGLQTYLNSHPDWDYDRALTAALGLFLLQGEQSTPVTRIYLDSMRVGGNESN